MKMSFYFNRTINTVEDEMQIYMVKQLALIKISKLRSNDALPESKMIKLITVLIIPDGKHKSIAFNNWWSNYVYIFVFVVAFFVELLMFCFVAQFIFHLKINKIEISTVK